MKRRPMFLIVAVLAAIGLIAASCGSEDDGAAPAATTAAPVATTAAPVATTAAPAATTAAPADASAADAGIAEARVIADAALAEPTSIGIDVPLNGRPEEGKNIGIVVCDLPTCNNTINNVTKAAAILGWTTTAYQFDGSPEDTLEKFEFALEQGVDAIVTTGVARSSYETAAQQAADQGVPIAVCCVPDKLADPFTAVITNEDTFFKVGQTLGAWVVADGGADTHTAMAILSPFEVHVALGEGFVSEVERLCDSCSAEIINSQIEDIGTNLPGLSVSILERSPEITHLMYADGVMAMGVVAALRDSGLDEDVRIGGMNPGPADLQAVIDGEHSVWLNLPEEWMAWMMVDSLARHFTGQETSVGMSATMPGQLIDQNNVKGTEKPAGAIGQAELFAALWGVG